MKRLTDRLPDGTIYVVSETGTEGVGHFTTQRRLPELIAKLAAYEDTGLEPEEIVAKLKWADHAAEVLNDIFGNIGVFDISHLRDLVKAEQEGRLVFLPY